MVPNTFTVPLTVPDNAASISESCGASTFTVNTPADSSVVPQRPFTVTVFFPVATSKASAVKNVPS